MTVELMHGDCLDVMVGIEAMPMALYHGTKDYELPRPRHDYRPLGHRCPDCGCAIQRRSTRCKPCAQKMRRKIQGQVARLLALAKRRREGR